MNSDQPTRMPRYHVSQFDGDTFVVIDGEESREVCVCGNYDEREDAKRRAEIIAALLNAVQLGAWD